MENQKISVIVPIYNAEAWLSRCLNSILNNSYENLEVICVNDGSTDNSLKLLQEFEKNDHRIVLVDQPNGGVSAARNKALEIASGEYISFVDADDWVHKDFFRIMMDAIGVADIAHCDLVRCDNVLLDKDFANIKTSVIKASDRSLVSLLKGPSTGMLYKRLVIGNIKFPLGVKMIEDKVFTIQVLCSAQSAIVLDCGLYYYYRNCESASHVYGLDLYPAAKEMLKIAKSSNNSVILHEAYMAFIAHRYLNMFDIDAKSIRKTCNQQLRECGILAKQIMPLKERLKLKIMVSFPFLYRLYRIATDSTMLDWEKSQKKKRRIKL